MTGQRISHITVRPAGPADYSRIALLTVAAYRHANQVRPGHPYEPALADVADRAAAGEVLVAEDSRSATVIGSVLFVRAGSRYAELCGPDEAEFRMLAVDPAAQGSGAGEALVRACLERASALGSRAVVIYTRDFAAPAHRLYRRLGFVRTPERDWRPARGVNLWAMRLDLPDRVLPGGRLPGDNGKCADRREEHGD